MVENFINLAHREDCDPIIESCSHDEAPLIFPEGSMSHIYWLAAVGLFNSVLPALYYEVSTDYQGKYEERSNLEIIPEGQKVAPVVL